MPAFEKAAERAETADEIKRLAGWLVCEEMDLWQAQWNRGPTDVVILKWNTHSIHETDEFGHSKPFDKPYFSLQFHFMRDNGSGVHALIDFNDEYANVGGHDGLARQYERQDDMQGLTQEEVRSAAWNETIAGADTVLCLWAEQLRPSVVLELPEPPLELTQPQSALMGADKAA